MTTVTVNRGEKVRIPFSITDAANGLAGKRVTWSVGVKHGQTQRVLGKASAVPGSTAGVTVNVQNAGQITGTINIELADWLLMPEAEYRTSLWIDSNIGDDVCVTPGGFDSLVILPAISRT